MPNNTPVIEYYKDKKGAWRWRALRGGHVTATGAEGNGYARKSTVLKAIRNHLSGFGIDPAAVVIREAQ